MDNSDIRNNTGELIASWEAARAPAELIEPVARAYERYVALGPEVGKLEADVAGAFMEIASEVAAGKLSLAEGCDSLAKRTAAKERISQASSALRGRTLYETASGLCLRTIRSYLETNAGALFAGITEAEAKPGRGANADVRLGSVQQVRGVLSRLGLVDPAVSVSA